jgi:hypothetical protein
MLISAANGSTSQKPILFLPSQVADHRLGQGANERRRDPKTRSPITNVSDVTRQSSSEDDNQFAASPCSRLEVNSAAELCTRQPSRRCRLPQFYYVIKETNNARQENLKDVIQRNHKLSGSSCVPVTKKQFYCRE